MGEANSGSKAGRAYLGIEATAITKYLINNKYLCVGFHPLITALIFTDSDIMTASFTSWGKKSKMACTLPTREEVPQSGLLPHCSTTLTCKVILISQMIILPSDGVYKSELCVH